MEGKPERIELGFGRFIFEGMLFERNPHSRFRPLLCAHCGKALAFASYRRHKCRKRRKKSEGNGQAV